MCRYSDHPYKFHYVCFDCRRSVKVRHDQKRDESGKRTSSSDTRAAKCPECGQEMKIMGRDFKAPRRNDVAGWRALRILVSAGYRFDSCGCPRASAPRCRPTAPGEAAAARKAAVERRDPIAKALRRSDAEKRRAKRNLTY